MKNTRKILSKFCNSIEHFERKITETLDKLGNFKEMFKTILANIKQF